MTFTEKNTPRPSGYVGDPRPYLSMSEPGGAQIKFFPSAHGTFVTFVKIERNGSVSSQEISPEMADEKVLLAKRYGFSRPNFLWTN